jgi:hypothetical protein
VDQNPPPAPPPPPPPPPPKLPLLKLDPLDELLDTGRDGLAIEPSAAIIDPGSGIAEAEKTPPDAEATWPEEP